MLTILTWLTVSLTDKVWQSQNCRQGCKKEKGKRQSQVTFTCVISFCYVYRIERLNALYITKPYDTCQGNLTLSFSFILLTPLSAILWLWHERECVTQTSQRHKIALIQQQPSSLSFLGLHWWCVDMSKISICRFNVDTENRIVSAVSI